MRNGNADIKLLSCRELVSWSWQKLLRWPGHWTNVCAGNHPATVYPTIMSRLQVGCPSLQVAARLNCSVSCRRLPVHLSHRPSPATIGRHRHVLCRVASLFMPCIPYFMVTPVFQPQSPASRNEVAREMRSSVFQLGPVSNQSPHT